MTVNPSSIPRLTLGAVIKATLDAPELDQRGQAMPTPLSIGYRRGRLIERINSHKPGEKVEVSSEDVTDIKNKVGQVFKSSVIVQVIDLLGEPAPK